MQTLSTQPRAFHVMSKPIGPICNLDCKYCFYLEKELLYPDERKWKMSDEVLEAYIRQYIESQQIPEIHFAWQGGEPTLLGVSFFRKVVELQARHANGQQIFNALQTNGTLLNDEWGEFLHANHFLIGLSIDGPADLHDAYRVDKQQKPTFDAVMRGLEMLKKHRVEFNTLTVINRKNSQKPREVYRFLKGIGSKFLQFIPLVEREAQTYVKIRGLSFAEPPAPEGGDPEHPPVTPWSVEARTYGEFLVQIYDEWVRSDVGRTYVQMFDIALGAWAGERASLCFFAETCGKAMAIEHNGDLYSCDHYVYPKYHLGNVLNNSMAEMLASPRQQKFGQDKLDTLPGYCRKCDVRFACNGECPKHRFIRTPDGEEGLNYLCAAYKRFFSHVRPTMEIMRDLLRAGQPPAAIMNILRARENPKPRSVPGRNDPCPCGSGKKFKKCCGAG